MKWYEVKERSAGEKRLILSYYIYKLFGRKPLVAIAFCVALVTFLNSKDLRECSAKYLKIVGIEPTSKNIFKHFLSYALSQVDKIEVFAGQFSRKYVNLKDIDELFWDCQNKNKGAVCIFSHVGNVDVTRILMTSQKRVSIFLSLEQAKIFRDFLNKFSVFKNVTMCAVEEIGADTIISLKQKVDDGEIVFIAGDRASKNSKNIEVTLLGKKVDFPLGTFKLAELLEVPVFFVSAIKNGADYDLTIKEFKTFEKCAKKMAESFADFVSSETIKVPFQFYHFYDLFKD